MKCPDVGKGKKKRDISTQMTIRSEILNEYNQSREFSLIKKSEQQFETGKWGKILKQQILLKEK